MAETRVRVTRFAADLMDSAAAEGARQSRSAKQQLDHWARVGRAVSSQHSAARRKLEAALAGEVELAELSEEEGIVFNAEISAAIEESLARADYGRVLAARGITTVALNEAGEIVEYRPDGTSAVVPAKSESATPQPRREAARPHRRAQRRRQVHLRGLDPDAAAAAEARSSTPTRSPNNAGPTMRRPTRTRPRASPPRHARS